MVLWVPSSSGLCTNDPFSLPCCSARGLGQLIRAKNIKTVGDLSTLTPLEIKTLPIRSPKVSNVKRALKGYHEQQVKFNFGTQEANTDLIYCSRNYVFFSFIKNSTLKPNPCLPQYHEFKIQMTWLSYYY